MTSTDAVRYGTGFEETGRLHVAAADSLSVSCPDEDALSPARGILWGILASGFLWAGLIVAGRALFGLLR